MRLLSFFVPGTPIPQGSMRRSKSGKLYHSNKKLTQWREAVGWAYKEQGYWPHEYCVSLNLMFLMPKPKKASHAWPRGDLDKLTRAIMDALTGIAYKDDSQVTSIDACKLYADKVGARITIEGA